MLKFYIILICLVVSSYCAMKKIPHRKHSSYYSGSSVVHHTTPRPYVSSMYGTPRYSEPSSPIRAYTPNPKNEFDFVTSGQTKDYGKRCYSHICHFPQVCVIDIDHCNYGQRQGEDCGSYPVCKTPIVRNNNNRINRPNIPNRNNPYVSINRPRTPPTKYATIQKNTTVVYGPRETGHQSFGQICKNITCRPFEVCVMKQEYCTLGKINGRDCGRYPICHRLGTLPSTTYRPFRYPYIHGTTFKPISSKFSDDDSREDGLTGIRPYTRYITRTTLSSSHYQTYPTHTTSKPQQYRTNIYADPQRYGYNRETNILSRFTEKSDDDDTLQIISSIRDYTGQANMNGIKPIMPPGLLPALREIVVKQEKDYDSRTYTKLSNFGQFRNYW